MEVITGSKKFLENNFCLLQVEILDENKFNDFDLTMNKLGYKLVKQIEDYYYSNFDQQ